MVGLILLLLLAKWQDFQAANTAAWQWALGYALAGALLGGGGWVLMVLNGMLLFLYTWGYFALLRRFTDSLLIWVPLYLGGALLPFLLTVMMLSKA
ncbi:hypothetical protein [Conchiformibius steedae]|uniref:Uncharacterized protein n=1 Tax=Conchiformibius steedae TaxID=153493 RepID=A0A3P2A350_9NEIS|nr:hypothetical protein [Conchiformibius steedae]RRD89857.1 hypothetical protein EII21_07445 [Conchiformibius steedae]